jgi:Putative phage abortive infection protein
MLRARAPGDSPGVTTSVQNEAPFLGTLRVGSAVLLVVAVVLGIYACTFRGGLSGEQETWGQFGDYVGGLLNPLISLLALLYLTMTYALQKRELAATKEAIGEQTRLAARERREARFFDLLRLYQDTVDELRYDTAGLGEKSGKRAIRSFVVEHFGADHLNLDLYKESTRTSTCNALVRSHFIFDHYFRVVYNLLRHAQRELPGDERYALAKLVRAQLSHDELFVLAINCLTEEGFKMSDVVCQFGLLKHIRASPFRTTLEPLLPPGAFGRAFAAQRRGTGDQVLSAL